MGGRRFAYLDSGGPGPDLLALHGHFGRGRIFAPLAAAPAGRYRVLAPDQRGHGLSDHGGPFTPDAYVEDAAALLRVLDAGPAAVLGHSMGGAVAFLLAARHPDLVRALVVADMTVRNHVPETQPVLTSRAGRAVPSRARPCAPPSRRRASRTPVTSWTARWSSRTAGGCFSTPTR
ncbi:alpha/beta hydrolase [Streptomyces olivaceiscleroticus]|uniref:alpha/beta fold hydrolase n=1 Tax=Streptomyces olivaceiscleroticus TaxID=68245 RepID=UPI0031F96B4D